MIWQGVEEWTGPYILWRPGFKYVDPGSGQGLIKMTATKHLTGGGKLAKQQIHTHLTRIKIDQGAREKRRRKRSVCVDSSRPGHVLEIKATGLLFSLWRCSKRFLQFYNKLMKNPRYSIPSGVGLLEVVFRDAVPPCKNMSHWGTWAKT